MALAVSSGNQAVSSARKWLGTPYCWGGGHAGSVPVGTCVDCSGLVNQVFGVTGNTFTQVSMGAPIPSIANAAPGDLVFFGPIAPGEPHHVGIYTGNGMMIDAPHSGTTVRQDSVSSFGPINAIRRLVGTGMSNGNGSSQTGTVQFTYAQLEGIWIQAGGSPQAASMAAAIAMAESGGNSQATDNDSNGSVDRGLWQINSVHGAQSTYDVMANARAAVAISNNGTNWSPWVTYTNGAYRRFLQTGVAPDMNVPINATNAAANQGGQDATLDISWWSAGRCIADPALCLGSGVSSVGNNMVGKAIYSIIGIVLNPLIEIVAGILGITAGAALMLIGIYLAIQGTETGRKATGLGLTAAGAATGQPELMAAGGASGRGTAGMAQAVIGQRQQAQQQQVRQQQVQERQVYRQQQMTTRAQINQQAYAYRQQQSAAQRQQLQTARIAAQAKQAAAQRSAVTRRQKARQTAMTQRQTQAHRQTMARARQRARLRSKP